MKGRVKKEAGLARLLACRCFPLGDQWMNSRMMMISQMGMPSIQSAIPLNMLLSFPRGDQ
jgi:hypothetical protein